MTAGVPLLFLLAGVVFTGLAKLCEDEPVFLVFTALPAGAGYVLAAFTGLMFFLQ